MSDNTKVEWCDSTWSPITGCTPVSEGCLRCCAANMCKRFGKLWGREHGNDFSKVEFHPNRLNIPMKWKAPRRIFVNLMSDTFHPAVEPGWIDEILAVIEACPQHTFMMLTKRPENIKEKLYKAPFYDTKENRRMGFTCSRFLGGNDYLPNLWLGVTAENQARFNERVPRLLRIPAAGYFVSMEPLLGPVDAEIYLTSCLDCGNYGSAGYISEISPHALCTPRVCTRTPGPAIDWLIVGAETGPGARPMNLEWARDLRDQCGAAGIPFFFKKAGYPEWKHPIPDDLKIRQLPEARS